MLLKSGLVKCPGVSLSLNKQPSNMYRCDDCTSCDKQTLCCVKGNTGRYMFKAFMVIATFTKDKCQHDFVDINNVKKQAKGTVTLLR